MIFNATLFSSLPLIARLFGVNSDEEEVTSSTFEEILSPTASPSSFSSFFPTEACDLECKTDYGKISFMHLVVCVDRFTTLNCRVLTFDQTVRASVEGMTPIADLARVSDLQVLRPRRLCSKHRRPRFVNASTHQISLMPARWMFSSTSWRPTC